MSFIKRQSLHQRKVGDKTFVLTADGNMEMNLEEGKTFNVDGNVKITGDRSGPKTQNVFYVSEDGSDTNDGRSSDKTGAFASVKKAAETAPSGSLIIVAPGDYLEDNPITLKDFVTISGQGELRNTRIFPKNNTSDLFLMGNGCYLFQMTFRGLRYPGWCAKIRPGALVTTSPYVQNCTNMNGPWLNDGTEFIPFETVQIEGIEPGARPLELADNPTLPVGKQVNITGGGGGILVDGDEYDPASLVFSFVADAFTQISQGGVGFHITNFGYTQIVSCFSVFCSTGFLTTKGGYLSISNSVSDFGTEGVVADGFYPIAYTTAKPAQDYFSSVASISIDFDGTGYTSTPTVTFSAPEAVGGVTATGTAQVDLTTGKVAAVSIVEPGSGYKAVPTVTFSGGGASVQATADVNLRTNGTIIISSLRDKPQTGSVIKFDGDSNYYYITSNTISVAPFTYNEETCKRDVRRIIDAVTSDIVMGTYYQSTTAATSYLRSTSAKVILDQLAPTVYAIEQVRDEMKALTSNLAMREEIDQRIAIITTTLNAGDSSATEFLGSDYLGSLNDLSSIDPEVIQAKDNVLQNRDFILDEISAYINDQFTELSYNQAWYEEDILEFLNALAEYIPLGGDHLINRSAREFRTRTRFKDLYVSSFDYLRGLVNAIANVAGDATSLARSNEAFNRLINIVDDGDSASITTTYVEHAGAAQNGIDAKDHLVANRTFIIAEFIAYLNTLDATLTYTQSEWEAYVGNLIDALTYDILYGGNSATVQETKYIFNAVTWSSYTATNIQAFEDAFARVRFIIGRIVRGLTVTKTPANASNQDLTSDNATQVEATTLDGLVQNLELVIDEQALTNLATKTYPTTDDEAAGQQNSKLALQPQISTFITNTIAYNLTNNPNLSYNVEKCKRDVGYIVEAVYIDAQLGTNHNSITAGLAYSRANTAYLNTEQKPATIIALREAKRLTVLAANGEAAFQTKVGDLWDNVFDIIEFGQLPSEGFEYPEPGPASTQLINAHSQLVANKEFLKADVVAYINNNNFTYSETKCRRDTGLIIDAAGNDALLGTNYNAVTAGLAYQRANSAKVLSDQLTETVAAITFAKGQSQTAVNSDGATQTAVGAAFDEVIDILQNGVGNADTLTYTNPSGATAGQIQAKDQLINNRDFLAAEAVAYIQNNYQNYSFSQSKCERDVGLIMDAVALDVALGTNYNAVTAGLAYQRASNKNLQDNQLIQTLASLGELKKELVLLGLSDAAEPKSNAAMDEIIDILGNGVISTDISADTITFTNPVGASQDLIDAKDQLQANREFIAQEVLAYVNANNPKYDVSAATYNQSTGDMVLTIGSHSYTTDDYIRLGKESLAFSCTYGQGAHTYVGGTVSNAITITAGSVQKDVTDATYNYATGILEMTIGAHSFTTSDTVTIGDNKLTFTCDADSNATQHTYPRSTDPASGNALAITAVTGTTISTNVGIIDASTSSTKKYPRNNTDPAYNANLKITATGGTTITVNVGPNTTNPTAHTFESATPGAVTTGYNQDKCLRDARYLVDALSHDILYGGNFAIRVVAQSYFDDGTPQLPNSQQKTAIVNAFQHVATNVIGDIVQNIAVTPTRERFTPAAGTTYDPNTGLLKLTVGSHNLQLSDLIKIEPNGITFTCLTDPSSPKTYPRATDPAIQRSFTPATGTTYNPATGELVLEIGSHSLTTNMQVVIAPNSMIFTCTTDPSKPKQYPRRTDPAHKNGLDITAVTATTITVNVGISSDISTHTFVTAKTNSVTTGLLPITALDATSITVDVGSSSDVTAHTWVSSVTDCVSAGNFTVQDTSNDPASSSEVSALEGDITIVTDAITANTASGLPAEVLPSVTWAASDLQQAYNTIKGNKTQVQENIIIFIANSFQSYTHDEAKCRADVALMIEAVAYDGVINTNYNQVTAGLAYQRASSTYLQSNQKLQTVKAIEYLRDAIDTSGYGLTSTYKTRVKAGFNEILDIINNGVVSTDTSADALNFPTSGLNGEYDKAVTQLQANRDYMAAETTAFVTNNYPSLSFDSAKCARDVKYIVDAICYDIMYRGNRGSKQAAESYFVGAASQLGPGQQAATVAAYQELANVIKDVCQNINHGSDEQSAVVQNTSNPGSDVTTANEADALLQIVEDVITAGNISGLPADDNPNITWTTASLQADFALLNDTARITSYQDDVANFVDTTFTRNFTFDSAKCNRDTKYIVDAITYDILYGGNSATHQAAQAYFVGATSQVAGQQPETAAALDWVNTLLGDVLLDRIYDDPEQGSEGQDVSGAGAATSAEVTKAGELLTIFQNVIKDGVDQLPTETFPDTTWASAGAQSAVANLQTQKATIIDATIQDLEDNYNAFTYDQDKCARDTGQIVEATAFDLLYTGNIATLTSTNAYFLGTAQYLPPEQVTVTVAAYTHLQDVAVKCIEGVGVTPQTGNTETQVLGGSYGTSVESTAASDLINITKTAIQNQTLVGTPSQQFPDFSWLPQTTRSAAALMLAEKANIQTGTITFINNNILGFTYNIEKCKRDTGYIVDAVVYDLMYGGNKQSRRAGLAYYSGAILGAAKVGNTDQVDITAYSYYYLGDILNKIAQNETVTPSFGNGTSQVLSTPDADTTVGASLELLTDRLALSVLQGYTTGWQELDHNHELGSSVYNTERITIKAATETIVNTSIAALNANFGGTAEINVFPGIISVETSQTAYLYNVSTISTSGHAFEYVGAGVTYNALPFFGGTAIAENEIIERNQGRVFAGGTVDQIGNFRVGNFFGVNALTGAITLNANEIDLSGLTSVGPFIRDGIPVGVELKEVSDNAGLISSIGTQDFNTVPTQKAVSTYVENKYLNKLTGGTVAGNSTFSIDVTIDGNLILTNNDLAVQYGGTGNSTLTQNGILYGNTANPIAVTDQAGTSDQSNSFQVLTVTSDVDKTPIWTDTLDGGSF